MNIQKKKCSSNSIMYWMLFMLQTLSSNFTYTSLNTHNNLNRQVLFLFPSTMRNWSSVCVCVCVCVSRSVVSNSLRPHGLEPTRLLWPWDSPGKNTGVGCHFLLVTLNNLPKVHIVMGFPGSSAGKESTCIPGDPSSILQLRRSPGEGNGYPLQYSGLENSMDCTVHGGHKELDRTEQRSLLHSY